MASRWDSVSLGLATGLLQEGRAREVVVSDANLVVDEDLAERMALIQGNLWCRLPIGVGPCTQRHSSCKAVNESLMSD